jgi:hypothetical protein
MIFDFGLDGLMGSFLNLLGCLLTFQKSSGSISGSEQPESLCRRTNILFYQRLMLA